MALTLSDGWPLEANAWEYLPALLKPWKTKMHVGTICMVGDTKSIVVKQLEEADLWSAFASVL